MEFVELKQKQLFENVYKYKFSLKMRYKIYNNKVIFDRREDYDILNNLKNMIRIKFPNQYNEYKFIRNNFYCKNLDIAFYFRMIADEKIKKIIKINDTYDIENSENMNDNPY